MDVDHLISQVFIRETLWDKCDKNHHNRFVLDKLWSEVAEELNTKQTAVKSRWKTLRDKFRSVLVTIPKPKSGDAQDCVDYTGEWKYYKSLLFLKDQFTPRQSSGNLDMTIPVPSPEESAGEDNDCDEDLGESSDLVSAPASTANSISSNASQSKTGMIHKRKKKDNIGEKLLQVEREKLNFLQNKKQKKEEDDEDINFFKSLLPYIKTLPPMEKLEYRMKVMKITQEYFSAASTSTSQSNVPTTQNTDSQSSAPKFFFENVDYNIIDVTEDENQFV